MKKVPMAGVVSGELTTRDQPESGTRSSCICYGDTAVHVVNDKVVMVLYESSYLHNNELRPLRGGKIQIQSEGAEVYYRNIAIRQINGFPAKLLE